MVNLVSVLQLQKLHDLAVLEKVVLGLKYAPSLNRFLSNSNVVAMLNSLKGFSKTLNVWKNSQSSRWFLLIRSATIG